MQIYLTEQLLGIIMLVVNKYTQIAVKSEY